MEIKDIIRNRRVELGLTMKELADLCGVAEGTVSRWESGHISNMRRDKVSLLSKALGIPVEVIMGWESDADRFGRTADKFNKAHTYFLTGKDEKHLLAYRELSDIYKTQVDELTETLLNAQNMLLAAHARTDTPSDKADVEHDISVVKQMDAETK